MSLWPESLDSIPLHWVGCGVDFAEEASNCFTDRGHSGSHQRNQKLLQDGEEEFNDPEEGSEKPDVKDGDDGEDEAPEDGHGDGDDTAHNLVEPHLCVGEEDEGQSPDRVKSMSS